MPKSIEETEHWLTEETGQRLCLGISDNAEEGLWVDKSGSVPSWTNWWRRGEPNNGNGVEHYAYIQHGIGESRGTWHDNDPNVPCRAICVAENYDGKYFQCILKLMVLFFKNFIRFKTRK